MTRRLTLWLTVVVLALGMALPAGVAADTDPSTKVYLALGDSLARGVGATDQEQGGYVPALYAFFRQPQHGNVDQLVNEAVSGDTSGKLLNDGQLATAIEAINAPTDVRVVTLDIGGNDIRTLLAPGSPCLTNPSSAACQQLVAAVLNDFAANYAQTLGELTQALEGDPGNETVLVMTYYNPFSGTGLPIDLLAEAAVRGLNSLIASIGGQYGATIVDVYPLFERKGPLLTHILTGDIHPNDAGYQVIADAFISAYKPYGFEP
jgi:lysophospholipase L1-like esterase